MALSGLIKKDFHKSGVFTLQIEWEATQNIANNTSTITARMYLISNTDGGTISSSVGKKGQIVIDGTTLPVEGVNVSLSAHQKKLLATKTHTITHNADGTRNFIISGSLDINVTLSGTFYGTISIPGKTFTLDTIPRASTISSFPNFTIGDSFAVTINRASSSFTHKLELKYGSTLIATRTGIGTSTTFTLTTAEENTLYSAMKNVTSGTVTMYCTTYQGSTKIGNTTSKTATASVSSSIVPSFDTITHSDVSTDIASVFGAYIQGKSRLNLAITGAAGAKYSTIVSYKIEFNQETYNSRTAVSGYIKGSGTLSIKGTVTDSRGRSYSKTVTINVLAYSPPKINSFRVDRCNVDGSLNTSGEYAKVAVSGEYKSLNGHNTKLLTIYSKTRNVSTYTTKHIDTPDPAFTEEYIIGTYDIALSYDFKVTLEDYFESVESTVVLGTAKVVLDLGRDGIGIGKYHEQGAIDADGDIHAAGDIYAGENSFLQHLAANVSHVLVLSRDISIEGVQSISLPFKAKSLIAFAFISGSSVASNGFWASGTNRVVGQAYDGKFTGDICIIRLATASNALVRGVIQNITDTGFEINWTKVGSPSGTATLYILANTHA